MRDDIKIGMLKGMKAEEEKTILQEWNRTGREYPKEKCVHLLFEEQAKRSPGAVAVWFKENCLTYEALNRRSNQFANFLRKKGVGPEAIVGVCVERSGDMLSMLLGILKAGGAYLPLDPEYPPERLKFMVRDAGLKILLTQNHLKEKFKSCVGVRILADDNWIEVAGENPENPENRATAKNLAYVMYTSGSTGEPKGVLINHQNIVRLLFGTQYASLNGNSRIMQAAPISFDAATFEIWGALLHGGQCILYPDRIPEADRLEHFIKKYDVNQLWLTSALFNSVVDQKVEALSGVRQLLVGGESLSVRHVSLAKESLKNSEIINGYGPTESTTFSCCYSIPRDEIQELTSVPIGKPIANTQVYILRRDLEVEPIGVPGEIYIGGDGLGRGYLNRPGLTAEKFVPNPFKADGERLYRTGDLGRWLEDGNIEFLGRIDQQVKIRGFRIELGEIETVINEFNGVKTAIVTVATGVSGDKYLRCHYITDGSQVKIEELKHHLRERLPEYMVPTAYMRLEKLPMTPNGKVDRKALPEVEGAGEGGSGYVAPRNATEEVLAGIWREVLGGKRAGVYDNFFENGGHSLLATQFISRVRSVFEKQMDLKTIFEHPTISEIAKKIDESRHEETRSPLGRIKPVDRNKPLVLSYGQERLWFLDKYEPNNPSYNVPVVFRIEGDLNVKALEAAFNEMVRRHEVLRTHFREKEGVPEQVIEEPVYRAPEVVDVEDDEEKARRIILEEGSRPFDLSEGPVIRWKLLKWGNKAHVVVLVMHHIARSEEH